MKLLRCALILPFVLALAVVSAGCQTSAVAEKKPVPASDADVVGTWVGLTEDGLHFFRLRLASNAQGLCAYVYLHNDARLLAIERWGVESGRIQIALKPLDDDPNEVTTITGVAHATVMEVTVVGKGWKRRLVMRREDDMERRAALAKSRMDQHKEHAGVSLDAPK